MKFVQSHLLFSATDLSNFLACPHLTRLSRAVALGEEGPPRKFDDPGLEVLQKRGEEHERAYLERLKAAGKTVVEVPEPSRESGLGYAERWERYAAATLEAMRSGADVLFQAGLCDGTWLGKADFLVRVEEPSGLGAWSYEVVDTKLAREAKGGALLQVLLYAGLLEKAQGRRPRHVHLALGGPEAREAVFRVAEYDAYFRSIRDRFLAHVGGAGSGALPVAPDPVEHCDICAWRVRCKGERRSVDHLSLVAGIHGRHRDALRGRGIDTMASLAGTALPLDPPLEGAGESAVERVRDQARIQVEGRRRDETIHELLEPVVAGEGLAALPEPSPGDLFFDIEGDRFAFVHGLEYLLGWVDDDGAYSALRALDRDAERAAFESFVDMLMARWERWPELHVYHYNHYETTALKKLAGLHGTRETEVDRLLRGEVFVDLYRVVRQGLRASVEKYSIKDLEPLYGLEREVALREAGSALAHFEAWLELGQGSVDGDEAAEALLEQVVGYNRDDCVSTLRLRDWLESQRLELERRTGEAVPRPEPGDGAASENVAEEDEEVARLVAGLTANVPGEEAERTPEEHGRWLLAQTLGFHRREDRSFWWQYFEWLGMSAEDLLDDSSALGGLVYEGVVEEVKQSRVHRYRFPVQEHRIKRGRKSKDPATQGGVGEVIRIDDSKRFIDIKRGKTNDAPHPEALIPHEYFDPEEQQKSLRRLADVVCDEGLGDGSSRRAASDLLLRRPPRCGQEPGSALAGDEEESLDAARRLALSLDRSVLPVQGPPGSGKTYTGARMILALLAAGKRVGITATSHKVITNLLDAVCEAADQAEARGEPVSLRGIQKASGGGCGDGRIEAAGDNESVFDALADGAANLAAGTAWLWSREDAAGSVDVLFVDEAGQFSLANALAVSQAGASLVLLGDPAQLEQPQQSTHPPGSDASALDHLLAGATTMPSERGLFLARTWRLHPEICAFTSEIYYGERLRPKGGAGLERQALIGDDELAGSGLRYVPVSHEGNQNESEEEARAVAALVDRLLGDGGGRRQWRDRHGVEHALTLDDIRVVAPYNAQVSALAARLPEGAQVGTVDKFQGQEAPVVIYSTASSSPDDAPRGMGFLYSPNRLNVATSRARCIAIMVGEPSLFSPDCRTPEQMRMANGFCRFRELAAEVRP